MKLRHFRKHTFKVCMAWDRCQNQRNTTMLINNLKRWVNGKRDGSLDPYPYTGDPLEHVWYCSDRMNSGRAKALLMLLDGRGE